MKRSLLTSGAPWCVAATLWCAMGCEPEGKNQLASQAATTPVVETTPVVATTPRTSAQIKRDSRKYGHVPIVGETTREAILAKHATWQEAARDAEVTEGIGAELAKVPPGAQVTVVFGTWCTDCFKQLPRLWKAMDQSEAAMPFEVTYIGLDETFKADRDLSAMNIHNIPTIIVGRKGVEVGRIIESSPATIEQDFLALLQGSKKGVISGNPKVRQRYGLDEGE